MLSRRAILVEPGRFEIDDVTVLPGAGEVVVKMEGCGLCTYELNHWAGTIGTCPQPLGHEGYGTMAEIGPGVDDSIKEGDRVTGLGMAAFADYFVIPIEHLMRLKPDLDQKHVPGEPLYCVQNVIRAAHPEAGDCIAIVGCGPMGLWALQGLASPALQAVIAIDLDNTKLELASRYGATHTINPATTDVNAAIEAITRGRMIDVAVEGTGAAPGVKTAIDILRPRNPKLVIMSSFKKPIEVDMVKMCGKAVEMVCAHPGISKDLEDGVRRTATLVNNGVYKIDDLITHQFPLEDINQAFQELENRPDGYLKGIVVP